MSGIDAFNSLVVEQHLAESRRNFIDSFQTGEERKMAEIVFDEQIDIHGGVTSEDYVRLEQEVRKLVADRPEITLNSDFLNDPDVHPGWKRIFAQVAEEMNSDLEQKLR